MSRDGLNPAHVPYWRVINPTRWGFCVSRALSLSLPLARACALSLARPYRSLYSLVRSLRRSVSVSVSGPVSAARSLHSLALARSLSLGRSPGSFPAPASMHVAAQRAAAGSHTSGTPSATSLLREPGRWAAAALTGATMLPKPVILRVLVLPKRSLLTRARARAASKLQLGPPRGPQALRRAPRKSHAKLPEGSLKN